LESKKSFVIAENLNLVFFVCLGEAKTCGTGGTALSNGECEPLIPTF
jgi:hypothetical protein